MENIKVLYKMSEWEAPGGRWYCGCIDHLGSADNTWYIPCRFLGISPAEYVKLILVKYKPDKYYFEKEKCIFIFSWMDQSKMRKFKNDMNAAARKVNFKI
jgi:hypothetical protein